MITNSQSAHPVNTEWGPNDPEVESIWILLKDAVKKIEDPQVLDEADFRTDRIYEKLVEARNHYITIAQEGFNDRPSSERIAVYNSLYTNLWSAYKDRLVKFTKSIGYDMGCIFAGDDYESQMDGFIKRYPEFKNLKAYVDVQKANWQDDLRDNRNGNNHDGDFRGKVEMPNFYNKESAKHLFMRVSRTIETLGVSLVSYKLPKHWHIVPLDNKATVFDRTPRYEIRHAVTG